MNELETELSKAFTNLMKQADALIQYTHQKVGLASAVRMHELMVEELKITRIGLDEKLEHLHSLFPRLKADLIRRKDAAKYRPVNYAELNAEQQWEIDKKLGILDRRNDVKNPK